MKIALIVGEISGDILGASLIESLRQHYPNLTVEGILGPKIMQMGYESLYPMERLSIMGFIEPIKRLPELIRLHRNIINHFTHNPPDVFIGIDAPDFNLRIEKKLKAKGIKTVHYVSPTVWAWRQGRIHYIKKSIDLMLSIFPFEIDLYRKYKVPIQFCGHPLADQIPLENDKDAAREQLDKIIKEQSINIENLTPAKILPDRLKGVSQNEIKKRVKDKKIKKDNIFSDKIILTLLPGSRNSEIEKHAIIYLQTAALCYQQYPHLHCIVAVVSNEHKEEIKKLHDIVCPMLPITILVSQTQTALAAADIVLVTSGTATLETLLHKKPMVVAYKANLFCYYLGRLLIKVPYISQPNLLANDKIVPEFIQKSVTPQNLSKALLTYLEKDYCTKALIQKYIEIHRQLRQDSGLLASKAVIELIKT